MSKRRPKNFQSCPGLVGDSVMVMDAQIEITYQMETNRAILQDDEAELVLGYLREDILQSLINMHCPKTQVRTRDRAIGSKASGSSATGLEALSVHATAPRLQESDCATTHADSLSCHTYSNDVVMLFDSDVTKEQLEADVMKTIQQFMMHEFYTNQVNLRLAEGGSSLHVTGFSFQNAQDQPPPLPETEHGNTETSQSSSLNIANVVGQEQSNNMNQASALTILMAVLAGFLFMLLMFILGKRYFQSSSQTNKSHPIKNGSTKNGSINGTLLTGDETIIEGDDEDEDDSTQGHSLANSDGYQPSCLEEDNELVHYVEVDGDGKVVKEPEEEVPVNTILGDLNASVKPAVETGAPRNSNKCSNTRCKACSKAPDNDPTYLCPNYKTPWGNGGHQHIREVSLRVFEEESHYHDRADDSVSRSSIATRSSISVIPPSRVNQVRSQSILSSYGGMEQNSLLASTSDEAAAETNTIEKIMVITPGRDPPYIQRTLRPARTVQL